jgi:signal transduction histidine kinase
VAFFDTWLKINRKQIAMNEREAPLRNELFLRILFFAVGAYILHIGLLWSMRIRDWPNFLFPSALFLAAVLARKWRPPLALPPLFFAIISTVVLPVEPAARSLYEYPEFGGALLLTILLSGLMMGKSFVRLWTTMCIMLQLVAPRSSWSAFALWGLMYVAAGWLVTLYSSHLQRLFELTRAAEEHQRNAIVAERTRFARDIHDTLAQGFTGIMMQLNAAEQRLSGDSTEARVHIEKARQLATESLEEARRSVSALRIASGSLLDAIEQIARKLTSDSGVQLETKLEGQPYSLQDQCEANLLRIAQEALTNAVRHSGTKRISIRLAYQTGSVVLEVGDSGRGMSGEEPSGFGVDGMRERACQIGGEIKILSNPGRGTRIVVTVPNA